MTVTVELINEGAMNLLRDMESLGLLHVNGQQPKAEARPLTPAPDSGEAEDVCPLCAKYYDPRTGQPPYNAETMAALAEGDAMLRGEIPSITYKSADEMWEDLLS
jgi:hypothetical protein